MAFIAGDVDLGTGASVVDFWRIGAETSLAAPAEGPTHLSLSKPLQLKGFLLWSPRWTFLIMQ